MKKTSVMMLLLFTLLLPNTSRAAEEITVAGTGASQALFRVLGRAFETAHPGMRIYVPESIGSGGGIKATAKGKCDIGRVARHLKSVEAAYNLNYKCFAYSPVVFAAHPSVDWLDSLTVEQIIGIWSGKITDWGELGGEKGKIYIVQREEGDAARSILEQHLPGFKEIEHYAGKMIYNTPETVKITASYKNTIAYMSLTAAKSARLHVFNINGVDPSAANVIGRKYNLTAPLSIVWKGELTGLSKTFSDFLFTPEARKLMAENGAVPVDLPNKQGMK